MTHDLETSASQAALLHDLERLRARRGVLAWLAGTAGFAALAACGASRGTAAIGASCAEIPEETNGPFPGDGTNGPNALALSGIVRSDIRASVAGTRGADGVPLTVHLAVQDVAGCGALVGAAVYAWHCDREGEYSMYAAHLVGEDYLRGVQAADGAGIVTFKTIVPGCYPGRWPHIHFEVYPSVGEAARGANRLATSQLALPADVCKSVYARPGYEKSSPNFERLSLREDNVFGDDAAALQMATIETSTTGVVASLRVAVPSTPGARAAPGPGGPGGGPPPDDGPPGGRPPGPPPNGGLPPGPR